MDSGVPQAAQSPNRKKPDRPFATGRELHMISKAKMAAESVLLISKTKRAEWPSNPETLHREATKEGALPEEKLNGRAPLEAAT